MIIKPASESPKIWNAFVEAHFPPVGAFMESWEWGEFQKRLGRPAERYEVVEEGETVAAFTLVRFRLPGNLSYGYVPRGPVMRSGDANPQQAQEVIRTIHQWVLATHPDLIFLRLEPPLQQLELSRSAQLRKPSYYVQPRYNAVVELPEQPELVANSFHPSTRSNLHRAEKRGITVEIKSIVTPQDRAAFARMINDTVRRNSGVNAYPSAFYFDQLFETVALLKDDRTPRELRMAALFGYQHGEPASAHLVLFFGKTATYLYGATLTDRLNSKVDTYLHWAAMCEARRRGCDYYDLGGVDSARWPSLTTFKRQFSKCEMSYMGNIDILIRPGWYKTYELLRKFRK